MRQTFSVFVCFMFGICMQPQKYENRWTCSIDITKEKKRKPEEKLYNSK